jgi:hypothetical protein
LKLDKYAGNTHDEKHSSGCSTPKDGGEFFTVEDDARNVLAYGRTIDEIAVKWRQIDIQKVLVEKLTRQSGGCSDQRLSLRWHAKW